MNTSKEFDSRLAKANSALSSKAPELSGTVVTAATKTRSKPSLSDRFSLMSAQAKTFAFGGLASGATAIVAVTLLVNVSSAPLIQLASSSGAENSRNAMTTEGSADQMMSVPFNTFEYLAGPGLSTETGASQVYRLVRDGDPESVVGNVAELFDVQGSFKEYPDSSDENPGYFYSESDDPWGLSNQNPMVSIWWSGTGSWNYSNPGDVTISSSSCAETDAEGFCQEWTEMLPTPELLPTRAEAVSKALEVFNATGLAVVESDLRVDYSDWGVSIAAALSVAGQPTSIEWYIGWSSTGDLSYAGGHSIRAEEVGTFETISPVQAIERLDDWRWSGTAATYHYENYPSSSAGSGSRDEQIIEPGFIDSEYQPLAETLTLTIVSSKAVLLTIWDATGNVWLVPGLIMENDQGWWNSVISLIDGVIALPEPSPFEIMPLPAPDSPVSDQ